MAFSNEEWEEVCEQLPKPQDAVIQVYLRDREALMDQEKKQRSDYAFRQSLSPIARKACAIVDRIRDDERRRIWTADLEEKIATEGDDGHGHGSGHGITVHPGQMFTHAKSLMETTTLWRIVRRMPKGALLHAHNDAMVEYDFIFRTLLATPGMHIRSPEGPLATPAQRATGNVRFHFLRTPRPRAAANPDPWDPAYVADTSVLLTDAADAFPDGGRDGFVAWLKDRCTLSPALAVAQHHGLDHVWRRFQSCFLTLGSAIHYEPVWRAFLRRLFQQLVDDGLAWVEMRFMWTPDFCREGCEDPDADYLGVFAVADEEIQRFRAAHPDTFWGARFIWTAYRPLDARAITESMDHCLATKLAFPHLIAGFDLVGQEDAGRPLRDCLPELLWFRQQCALEGVELPFFFHAGECLGDGDATDSNLFDAILLGTRRIGHGFSLYKHPLLVDLVKEKRILLEVCPISNEVLRLCGSILSHPMPALLARGVACNLNNDDPAILGQDAEGMSHDFWQALQGWHNLGLAGLGSLAENSIRWSAFEDQSADAWQRDIRDASLGSSVKARHLQQWRVSWEQFCLWIVTEFGDQYGEDD